jgi:hypothetical protein
LAFTVSVPSLHLHLHLHLHPEPDEEAAYNSDSDCDHYSCYSYCSCDCDAWPHRAFSTPDYPSSHPGASSTATSTSTDSNNSASACAQCLFLVRPAISTSTLTWTSRVTSIENANASTHATVGKCLHHGHLPSAPHVHCHHTAGDSGDGKIPGKYIVQVVELGSWVTDG